MGATRTAGIPRIHRTPLPRAEQPWRPPYEYRCSGGHHLGADRPVAACPVYVLGERCDGELARVGQGARS